MKKINKTIAFTGMGDAFIVSLKLLKLYHAAKQQIQIDHLFVESNQRALDLIKEWLDGFCNNNPDFKFSYECDPNYEQNWHAGKWSDRKGINTSICGDYHFPEKDGIALSEQDVSNFRPSGSIYLWDVTVQCSAGAKSDRHWKFDVKQLVKLLRNKNLKVAIIGSDDKYYDEKDKDNYVNKVDIKESSKIIDLSNVYVGLSGFQTYRSLMRGVKNVHLEESEQHNRHYLHPTTEKFRYGIKFGSLQEVIQGLRYWGINV